MRRQDQKQIARMEGWTGALTKDHDGSPATVLGAALDVLAGVEEGQAA